jgi:hypothetical protein
MIGDQLAKVKDAFEKVTRRILQCSAFMYTPDNDKRAGITLGYVDTIGTISGIASRTCSVSGGSTFKVVINNDTENDYTMERYVDNGFYTITITGNTKIVAGTSGFFWVQTTRPNVGIIGYHFIRVP